MEAGKNNNINWINTLKGIGIIAVVIGHAFPPEKVAFIYLFHMPLFFVLSGYLYKPSPDYKTYAIKKSGHLLIPYLSFLLLMVLPYHVLKLFRGGSLPDLLKSVIIGGRYLKDIGTVFWFVTCLFATQQLFNWLYTHLNKTWLLACILISITIAYVNSEWFPKLWLPWNLNVVFMALPMFYAGTIIRQANWPANKLLLVFLAASIIVIISFYSNSYTMNMKTANYGIPILSLIASMGIIIILINIAKLITQAQFINTIISKLGIASMTIMYVHKAIIMAIIAQVSVPNLYLVSVLTICFSYLMHIIFNQYALSRKLLLGSNKG